jgi:hypothetical protein
VTLRGITPVPPLNSLGNEEMIDRNAYERKVMIIQNCLSLARVYHDQENSEQSKYYSGLATEYFSDVLGLVEGAQ